jgi:hypothetical protein
VSDGCFVIGAGRCGSTLLSNVLRLHPGVLSLSEFFSAFGGPARLGLEPLTGVALLSLLLRVDPDIEACAKLAAIPELLATRGCALELVALPHLGADSGSLLAEIRARVASSPAAHPGTQIARLFDWLRAHYGRQVWVERSGASAEYLDPLAAMWPLERRLYLLRDGRDCALSMADHPLFRVRVARLVRRDPALCVAECLRASIPLDRFGAYWSVLMQRMHRAWDRDANALVVTYESLLESSEAVLGAIGQFLCPGHAEHTRWVARAQSELRPNASRWRALPAPERERLERSCLPGMRALERMCRSHRDRDRDAAEPC